MKKHALAASLLALLAGTNTQAATSARPVVVELFTSQGCSSCPPADELLTDLSADPSIVALSFHVNYWDYLGWKDPYSSTESTERQHRYAAYQNSSSVFTPQAMVDGSYSAVGSRWSEVKAAIVKARANAVTVPITLTPQPAKKALAVHIEPNADAALNSPATVLAVRFDRTASTPVKAGENRGSTLKSVNNVTGIERLGSWQNKASDYTTALPATAGEGVAILVQNDSTGRIIASAIQ